MVSQNCDGLHRRSGLPKNGQFSLPPSPLLTLHFSLPAALFELHGNSNVEKCVKCGHEYLRDYDVYSGMGLLHYTGRYRHCNYQHSCLAGRHCDDPKCRGRLMDTIINFGENLPGGTPFN